MQESWRPNPKVPTHVVEDEINVLVIARLDNVEQGDYMRVVHEILQGQESALSYIGEDAMVDGICSEFRVTKGGECRTCRYIISRKVR